MTPVAKRSVWLSYGASHTLLDRWEPNLGSEADVDGMELRRDKAIDDEACLCRFHVQAAP